MMKDKQALRATGVAARDIRLLTGRELGDVRREPVGGFAGPVAPDAPVGTYGGGVVLRRQGAGGFAGDPDRQRQGSFADTDRVMLVTCGDGAERARDRHRDEGASARAPLPARRRITRPPSRVPSVPSRVSSRG